MLYELLKALWGGHTAALQFMLGIQLQVGDRKHAIRDRRFARGREREDMHTIYLAGSVSNTSAAGVIRAVVGADGALDAKRERDSSHRPFFKSSRSGKITIRTAKRAMCAMRASKLCVES